MNMVDDKFIENLQKSSKLPMAEYVENTIRLELEKATARGGECIVLTNDDYNVAKQEGIMEFKHYPFVVKEGYTKVFFKGVEKREKSDKVCKKILCVLIPLLILSAIGSLLV